MNGDHRKIGRRLVGDIFSAQLAGFLIVDCVIALGILLYRADAFAYPDWSWVRAAAEGARELVARLPWLNVTWFEFLIVVVAVEILCLIVTTARLSREVKAQVEPLREVRVARDDIEEKYEKLEQAYAAQSKFVSDASHELRTPIAVIQGYANLLSRWGTEDPGTLKESVEAIRTESESMKQLVNQLLFLARGDNDTLAVDFQRVDLVPILAEVLREEDMIEEEHALAAELPDEPVRVSGDAALLKQLVRILVDNAVKYTPAGGEIRLSLTTAVDAATDRFCARVSVSDEGQGIPPEVLPRVFDRFVRADEARTRHTGGSGLGLAIAKQIAERHGGRIEAVSREGIGSRFTVVLPLA
ncbi:MAG: HAMP domain-containing histidine kinase [Clostridiales Family XIII bacterium]|jgi:signal transduction histidine kinase|nr:HAMP domain-containing histidine kinase [Clostridiales Family XIII bacterium]